MISKGLFSLFLLIKSSCFLSVCHWLNYRPYPHLCLSPAFMSVILAVVHVENFAMPSRRKLSTLISWGILMREWRNTLLPAQAMAHVNELWTIPRKEVRLHEVKPTDCTISGSKTGYSQRRLKTARYHIHHFIHHLSQNFWESWRVDIYLSKVSDFS